MKFATQVFYFFAETNNAKNQPIIVQPNIQAPHLVRIKSYLERSFIHAI